MPVVGQAIAFQWPVGMGLRPAKFHENVSYHERRIPSRDRQGAVVPKIVDKSRSRIFDPVVDRHACAEGFASGLGESSQPID